MIKIRRCERGAIEFSPSLIPKISLSFDIETDIQTQANSKIKIVDARAYLKLKDDNNEWKEACCLQLDLSWMAKLDFPDVPSVVKLCTHIPKELVLKLKQLANSGKIELSLEAFFLSHDHKWIRAQGENAIPYVFQIYSSEWKEASVNLMQEKKGRVGKNDFIRELKDKVQINIFEEYATKGEQGLRDELALFDTNYLKAIIARYSLDHTNKTYRWKTKEKLIDFIVDTVESDIKKGKYFLDLSTNR